MRAGGGSASIFMQIMLVNMRAIQTNRAPIQQLKWWWWSWSEQEMFTKIPRSDDFITENWVASNDTISGLSAGMRELFNWTVMGLVDTINQ